MTATGSPVSSSSILSYPPEQRRVILVASEEKRKHLTPRVPDLHWWQWALIIGGGAAAGLAPFVALGGVSLSAMVAAWRLYHAASLARGDDGVELLRFWKEVIEGGEPPFPVIDPVEVQRVYKFDVGQYPVDGSLYVQHFTKPDYYLLPADYNPRLARQKFAAFKMIAADLGAKKVEIVSAQSLEKNWRGKAKVPVPEAAAQVGIEASFDSKGALRRTTTSEYGPPRTDPRVLPEHQAWIEQYPDLAAMVHGRLEQNMLRDRVSLEMKDSCAIGAKVVADVAKYGFEVGGSYESVARSLWHYEIEYWPLT